MHMADYVIDSPLRTAEQVKDFVGPMYAEVPRLRAAMRQSATDLGLMSALTDKMVQLRDCLFASMCDNYIEMSKREALALNHPGSAAIILFIYCGTLTILAKDTLEPIPPVFYDVARKRGLTIYKSSDPRHDPRTYTAQNILDLIWLISNRWPLLRVTDRGEVEAIFKYLQHLVHRTFFIVGQPHPSTILDCKQVAPIISTKEPPTAATPSGIQLTHVDLSPRLFKANLDLIRRYVDGLCRMMGHIRFFFVLEWKPAAFPPHVDYEALVGALRKRIITNVTALMRLPSLRQEIRMMHDRLSARHCDFAAFIEKCNGEPFEPTSMMMMTKPPEYQTAAMQYGNCVDLLQLCKEVQEGDADYSEKVDILAHLMAQNIKLHAIDMDLPTYDIKLRGDYVLTEVDYLAHISNTIKETFPSFISFMGRYHVIFGRDVYICEQGIEQALCMWSLLIMRDLKGQLKGLNVTGGICKIFSDMRALIQSLASDGVQIEQPHVADPSFVAPVAWGDESFI